VEGSYKKQVGLLLSVLPEVAKESCFALQGGTAINLFIRDMPRLSVDIDLIYVNIEDRQITLSNINQALLRIKDNIEALNPRIRVMHRELTCKLQISENGVQIKVEVNMVGRGCIEEPEKLPLCAVAQERFDVFCSMALVPISQLYGGKICAALDRQHPRDLFDIKLLFENEGFNDDIKRGFLYGLLSSDRPAHELLNPHQQDQRSAFENQFEGMTEIDFCYDEYEQTRDLLIKNVNQNLTDKDKQFLLGVIGLDPDWSLYDFEQFPSIQWKLQNLEKLRAINDQKFKMQYDELASILQG